MKEGADTGAEKNAAQEEEAAAPASEEKATEEVKND